MVRGGKNNYPILIFPLYLKTKSFDLLCPMFDKLAEILFVV